MKTTIRNLAFAGLFVSLVACGSSNKQFDLAVEFPDEASRTATASVQIYDIIPFLEANCGDLMDGTAVPGDSDYFIEDQILIALPDATGARPLTIPEEGRRLFFAQAMDADGQVILRGCNDLWPVPPTARWSSFWNPSALSVRPMRIVTTPTPARPTAVPRVIVYLPTSPTGLPAMTICGAMATKLVRPGLASRAAGIVRTLTSVRRTFAMRIWTSACILR